MVVILRVGTNGKLVIEPLPVTNRIRLQPAPTCPAIPSKSLPGPFINVNPGADRSRSGWAYSIRVSSRLRGSFLCTAPSDLSAMLYNPRKRLPAEGLLSAVRPCHAILSRNRSSIARKARAVAASRTFPNRCDSPPIVSSVSVRTPVAPWRIASCTSAPASGFPETPENASDPPHCRAMRRPLRGSGVRRSAATAGSHSRIRRSPSAKSAINPRPKVRKP